MTQDEQEAAMMETPTPESIPQWNSLGLTESVLETITKAGYLNPTPVQAKAIPIALDGRDLMASAQTGTGKTACFVLPLVERILGRKGTYGLILAPTREIAQQTQATIELLGKPLGITSIVLIGGVPLSQDDEALQTHANIIVATPGRLCDHLERGKLWLDFTEMLVLDEADRMLNMGFSEQLNRIMSEIPDSCQRLLFSATFPPSVEKLASKFLYQPEKIIIGKSRSANTNVTQRVLWMNEDSKSRELRKLLETEKGSIIVFLRSKDAASRIWMNLHSAGVYDATCIHSDRLQAHREQALADFKSGKYRILIATDVVGRGIHVDSVAHVVNYDLPLEAEDYVHRIGRTGRKDAKGEATSFVTRRDASLLRDIEKMLGYKIESIQVEPVSSDKPSGKHGRHRHHRRK